MYFYFYFTNPNGTAKPGGDSGSPPDHFAALWNPFSPRDVLVNAVMQVGPTAEPATLARCLMLRARLACLPEGDLPSDLQPIVDAVQIALCDLAIMGQRALRLASGADLAEVVLMAQDARCLLDVLGSALQDDVTRHLQAWIDDAEEVGLDADAAAGIAEWCTHFPLPAQHALRPILNPVPAFLHLDPAPASEPPPPSIPAFGRSSPPDTATKAEMDAWCLQIRNLIGERLRRHLAGIWRWAGMDKPLAPLTRILRAKHRDQADRLAVLAALGVHGHPIGIMLLCATAQQDAEPELALAAIAALEQGGGAWALPILRHICAEGEAGPARAAGLALARLGRPDLALALSGDGDPQIDAIAAAACNDLGGLAGIALGADEEAAQLARDLLMAASARDEALEAARQLLDPDNDARVVLVTGPRLAAAAPAALRRALLEARPGSDHPCGGRLLWLAGLLGAEALPVLDDWVARPRCPTHVHMLRGLAGAPAKPGEHLATRTNRLLLRPDGFGQLIDILDKEKLHGGQILSVIYPLLQHRLIWPETDDGIERQRLCAVLQSRVVEDGLGTHRAVWVAGELALEPMVPWLCERLRNEPYAAWALAEIGGEQARQAMASYAAQVATGDIEIDPDSQSMITIIDACVHLHIDRPDLLEAARPHWAGTLPFWRLALRCAPGDLADADAASIPPAALIARAALNGLAPSMAEADDLPQALQLLLEAGRADAALGLLGPIERQCPELLPSLAQRIAQAGPSAQAVHELRARGDASPLVQASLAVLARDEGPALNDGIVRRLQHQEQEALRFSIRLLDGPEGCARIHGILGTCRVVEGFCWRVLPRRLDRELARRNFPGGRIPEPEEAEDLIRRAAAEAGLDISALENSLHGHLARVLERANRSGGFSQMRAGQRSLGFAVAALTLAWALARPGPQRDRDRKRLLDLAGVTELRNRYCHGGGEGAMQEAGQLRETAESVLAGL